MDILVCIYVRVIELEHCSNVIPSRMIAFIRLLRANPSGD